MGLPRVLWSDDRLHSRTQQKVSQQVVTTSFDIRLEMYKCIRTYSGLSIEKSHAGDAKKVCGGEKNRVYEHEFVDYGSCQFNDFL